MEYTMESTLKNYRVHMTFKFPSWDEREGYTYEVMAADKRTAITYARRLAANEGHLGVRYFKATEHTN